MTKFHVAFWEMGEPSYDTLEEEVETYQQAKQKVREWYNSTIKGKDKEFGFRISKIVIEKYGIKKLSFTRSEE